LAPQSSVPHENQDSAGERSGVVKRLLPQWGPPGASRKPQVARRVMVVDDDQEVREILQQWLENEGFQVTSASDGVEAMKLLQREPGKWVILLDLRMPRMDGWAVLHQLQADALLPQDHKVVLMSAEWLLAQEGPPWRSPQVVAAVPKPFDLDQMLTLLTDLTSK
jgi:CheY-like chemotaxis protein